MIKQNSFSHDINADDCADLKLDNINHPRIKQIVVQVLAESTGEMSFGSEFGEGGFAG